MALYKWDKDRDKTASYKKKINFQSKREYVKSNEELREGKVIEGLLLCCSRWKGGEYEEGREARWKARNRCAPEQYYPFSSSHEWQTDHKPTVSLSS